LCPGGQRAIIAIPMNQPILLKPLAVRFGLLCFAMAAVLSPVAALGAEESPAAPIALNPANPHYFLFRGKPTFLLGSTEHYGAVLNGDFDYARYLDTLQKGGMNLTRLFSGAYVEPSGAFNIAKNTLAPEGRRFLCPWARSETDGYAGGGRKFDLGKWDEAYFTRLKDFITQAGRHGVVVEVVLFCPYYDEAQWALSPLNARNNVNSVGDIQRTDANTLHNGKLLETQQTMVRKIAGELKGFDNLYYEICNEPYFGGVALDWQYRILDTLADAEKDLPRKHLVAQNISNGSKKIEKPNLGISIFNFHYATPPEAVAVNYDLGKVIGDDETGFKGTGDEVYRMEAWEFFLAGGGSFDHLDYSFTVGHEDGTFEFPPKQPGGGGTALRKQFRILRDFLGGFDFVALRPDHESLKSPLPAGTTAHMLSQPGEVYALYLHGGSQLTIKLVLPAGRYHVEWVNPRSGGTDKTQAIDHPGGEVSLQSPAYSQDVAVRVLKSRP
jgi:hypothetical protein